MEISVHLGARFSSPVLNKLYHSVTSAEHDKIIIRFPIQCANSKVEGRNQRPKLTTEINKDCVSIPMQDLSLIPSFPHSRVSDRT